MVDAGHPYNHARFALLTQHGKETVVASPLRELLGARLDVISTFDTDTLGTFTRDIPRPGTQLDAARRKATLAVEHGGTPLGLGSEGSFNPGPFGFGTWNLELLAFVDAERQLEVVGRASAPGLHHHATVTSRDELTEFCRHADFPAHGLVVRPDHADHPSLRKGLRSWPDLEAAFQAARAESKDGRVFVEHDLRAHQNPTRMATIAEAARDLVERLACRCPACASPGFGLLRRVPGLPCSECGTPTDRPVADEFGCVACDYREQRARPGLAWADPGECGVCNP
jgi:hypothetical protein